MQEIKSLLNVELHKVSIYPGLGRGGLGGIHSLCISKPNKLTGSPSWTVVESLVIPKGSAEANRHLSLLQ